MPRPRCSCSSSSPTASSGCHANRTAWQTAHRTKPSTVQGDFEMQETTLPSLPATHLQFGQEIPNMRIARDVMVDIETLSTRYDAAILSIGAVAFDRKTGILGPQFLICIDPRSTQDAGLHIDAGT